MCGSQEEAEFNDFPLKFTSNMLYVLILLLVGHDNENLAAAEILLKATLSVDPPTGVVVRGESISFTCSSWNRGIRCELFKNIFPVYHRDAPKDSFYCKFVIEKAERTDTANYRCMYRVQLDGVWIDSMQSDPVQLTVVELPSKPTLSVDPPTVVRGEGVSFICSSRSRGLRHQLFKDQQRIDYRDTPNDSYNMTFVIPNARSKGIASYQCICGKFINGDWRYSERSDPVQLTVVDQLLKPKISMDPASGVVTVGENVTITCIGLTRYDGDSYYLYSEVGANQIDQRNVAASERSVTFTIATLSTSDTGKYTCSYQTSIARKLVMSPSSNSVQITVEELPSKPTLSLDPPTGVVVRREGVSFICSSRSPGLRHELFKDQQRTDYRYTPNDSYNATFVIQNAWRKGTAIYHCICGKFINGDWRYSERSDPVQLTVVDQLPKPKISMDPASGVVTVGESVTITCTGLTRYDGDSYYLYSEVGANQIDQRNVTASKRSVTFTIATMSTRDTGNYTCSYQTAIARKPEMSPSSNSVQITVEDSGTVFAMAVGLTCAAIIILALLLGLTGIWLCRRRRGVEAPLPLDPVLTDQPATSNIDEPIIYADLNIAALTQATSASSPDTCVYAGVRGQ